MTWTDGTLKTKRYIARKRAAAGVIECGCGCGTTIPALTSQLKPARFVRGHVSRVRVIGRRFVRGQTAWNKGRPATWALGNRYGESLRGRAGRAWTDEQRRARSEAYKGRPSPMLGKHHSEETRAYFSRLHKGRALPPDHPSRRTGPAHPAWRGGVSQLPYGPGFTRTLRRRIRDRDHHTCQRCGRTATELGYTMPIHHLDHDKANNDPTNLVTACHACNVWASWHRDELFVREGEVA